MDTIGLYLMATCVFSVTNAQVSDGCKNPLGMKDGRIQDRQLTSSSVYTSRFGFNYDATEGRLDGQSCWAAEEANSEQWIRVHFDTPKYVAGILLQGCPNMFLSTWVTEYKVQYGIDDSSNWQNVKDENQNDMIFQGNLDRNSQVTSLFTSEVWVTRVRICPTEWNPGKWISIIGMRFEILGCEAAATRASVVTTIATSSESVTKEFSVTATTTIEELASKALARSSGSASTAAGASIASIVLLIIIGGVVVLIVMKRRRRQQHPESSKPQNVVQLDGPYGDTVTNIITSPPTKDPHIYAGVTGANGDAVATPPTEELYQDVSGKTVKSSPGVQQGTAGTYQDITEGAPRSAENGNRQEGWVENDIYARSDEDQQPKRQTGDDNKAEGWVENDIYARSDEDQLKRQSEENDKEEGWMNNSIYASTDE